MSSDRRVPADQPVSVAVVAREKFSAAASCMAALAFEVPHGSQVVIVDSGYPAAMIETLGRDAAEQGLRVDVLSAPRYCNTNLAWNLFRAEATEAVLLCVENDVQLLPGAVASLVHQLTTGEFDVVVPVIFEDNTGTIHFDPPRSEICEVPDGLRSHLVRRPKPGAPRVAVNRRIEHLEKHCFMMSASAAERLGALDAEMHCRTDIDISLQVRRAGLHVGLVQDAGVVFLRDLDLRDDEAIFDYRWNIERAKTANARLVSKWSLVGQKSSVEFVQEMRDVLHAARGSASGHA